MKTVESVIEKLSRAEIMKAVGVNTQAVTNAKTAQAFPGNWYGPLAKLAKRKGFGVLPHDAFAWREGEAA